MRKYLLLVALFCFLQSDAQNRADTTAGEWQGGMELDLLPFALGGYFGASWLGKDQYRLRLLIANVHKPDFTTNSVFTRHRIHAYALVADYFLQPHWHGWWVGAGPVYWQSTIESKSTGSSAAFSNWLLNGSAGYHFPIGKRIYFAPWAGISIRIAGDTNIPVGTERYSLPVVNPEISVKFGLTL